MTKCPWCLEGIPRTEDEVLHIWECDCGAANCVARGNKFIEVCYERYDELGAAVFGERLLGNKLFSIGCG